MKKQILIPALILLSLATLNCSKESSNKSANNQIICPAGTYYNGTNCIHSTNNNPYQNTNISFGASVNFPYQQATMSSNSGMSKFLEKVMGTCNRAHSSGGLADCSSWSSGPKFITIKVPNASTNQVTVMIGASPKIDPYYNYTYQLPSWKDILFGVPVDSYPGAYYNPLGLNGNVHPFNNSQGFEIIAQGPSYSQGFNGILTIRVTKGKFQDASFAFTARFQFHDYDSGNDYDLDLMSGTMYRQ